MCYISEIKCSTELSTPEIIIYKLISAYASTRISKKYFCIVRWVNYATNSTLFYLTSEALGGKIKHVKFENINL